VILNVLCALRINPALDFAGQCALHFRTMPIRRIILAGLVLSIAIPASAASYKYKRRGEKSDVQTTPVAGIALMGGGEDLDDAFRWLCQKASGGDFLVLRARGDDAYNPYVFGLCKLNSAATLVIPDRKGAMDPKVADIIKHAEAVFIAGGDQSRYVNFWQGTLVEEAINAGIAAGKPIGGTSAGLAVLGEFAYGALKDKKDDADLASKQVLPNPYFERVTLVRNFLRNPQLKDTLTDSHFAIRDRMGRTLGFLARLMQDGWSEHPREVAIDEKSAVLVEADGRASVVGSGRGAYFLRPTIPPAACKPDVPLTLQNIAVYHVPRGGHFDVAAWSGSDGNAYQLSVENGTIHSTQADNAVY
jgi:cyanophycinase